MRILILPMSFCISLYNEIMFGKKIKELRKERGLTQKQLAYILECNQSMITRWEKEECEPTENVIRKVAIFFRVSADYLLGLEDESGRKITQITNSFNNNSGNIDFKN